MSLNGNVLNVLNGAVLTCSINRHYLNVQADWVGIIIQYIFIFIWVGYLTQYLADNGALRQLLEVNSGNKKSGVFCPQKLYMNCSS